MQSKRTIKYRHGFPTKGCLKQLINDFDPKMNLYPCDNYGKVNQQLNALIWQDLYTQKRMHDFIRYAEKQGLVFGIYEPYTRPIVGHLHIVKRIKDKEDAT